MFDGIVGGGCWLNYGGCWITKALELYQLL